MAKRRRSEQSRDLARDFADGQVDEDQDRRQRFSRRSAGAEQRRIERTALLRAAEEQASGDIAALPVGLVVQVHSLYSQVEPPDGVVRLCIVRKTLARLSSTALVVGDEVRYRDTGLLDEAGRPQAIIEHVLPRRTILTRADSFKAIDPQPIVANADQMLIVAALREPPVKWGLIDRMIVAARSGSLRPIVCLNKTDLSGQGAAAQREDAQARQVLAHYAALGIPTLRTSALTGEGIEELRRVLHGQTTVLAGHSGVGKSHLVRHLEPGLDVRIGQISHYTGKGRHTTSSARRYTLALGAHVIDTPGVKLFGLWGITRDNLIEHFPDVEAGTAPAWRQESYQRILDSLPAA